MEPLSYSIVIPAYNESDRIAASLEKIVAFLAEQRWSAEVLVVNDGSSDNTAAIVREFAARYPFIRLIENPGNRGKGYSVRNGMLQATGDRVLFTDADLSAPITEAPKLFAEIEKGADVVFGSRWLVAKMQTERQSIMRQVAGRMYNIFMRVLLGLPYKDTQCGFKAFDRKAIDTIFPRQHIERWGFDVELLFLARKFQFRITEVPVQWAHDDRSKINPLVDGIKMFGEMVSIRWNSLTGRYSTPHLTAAPVAQPVAKIAK
ncbi:MAG TPA: dolichyl-phosphate beta-glucosyltransferase [Candidatus Koribacter sp.]|jgi:glycosyltransferase involved in cell wall biosynthesis